MTDQAADRRYFWMMAKLWFVHGPLPQREELEPEEVAMDEDGVPSEVTPEMLAKYMEVRFRR